MARLAVNVDHVANVRQARGIDVPDPITAAMLAELAGACGLRTIPAEGAGDQGPG